MKLRIALAAGIFPALVACTNSGGCADTTYRDEFSLAFGMSVGKVVAKILQGGTGEDGSDCTPSETSRSVSGAGVKLTLCYFGMPATGMHGCTFLSAETQSTVSGQDVAVPTDRLVHVSGTATNPEHHGVQGAAESASGAGGLEWTCGQSLDSTELSAHFKNREALCRENASN